MKGDFSFIGFDPASGYSGVLHQQGRVLLDRDWNDAQAIAAHWRAQAAGDSFGWGLLAVPASAASSWQVLEARSSAAGIQLRLAAGHAWASGLLVSLAKDSQFEASYLGPPLTPAVSAASAASIGAGVRDAVVLEVFEDTVNGWQDAANLIEPALGGPDTTERVRAFTQLRLLRLGPNEDCAAVAALVDDPATRGKLSVTPAAAIVINGDCPLEAAGGYTGLEHFLYRIEIAEPAGGQARFKWSQFNGGLVGRGSFTAGALPGSGRVDITANQAAIQLSGSSSFYLEALAYDAALGHWTLRCSAQAALGSEGELTLSQISGAWPAGPGGTAFFRLWNGIEPIAPYAGGAPQLFRDGIELQFEPPAADLSNYRPGNWWSFPVRANGLSFEPPHWPLAAPPSGRVVRRVALAEIHWQADLSARWELGQIEDCRKIFRPLSQQKICCSYIVGDGLSSFGDFNSIELALRHLPAEGGEICLLPGLHHCNALIQQRVNVSIRGCGARTRVLPREQALDQPIFSVIDSRRVEIEHMDLVTLGGTAFWIAGSEPGLCDDIRISGHRILACTHALRAVNASHLTIEHNHIRMFDKPGGLAALDVAGDDVRIERNEIGLLPAELTPPVDPDNPDDPEDPINPVDPCVRLVGIYKRPRVFIAYVNRIWQIQLPLSLLLQLLQPYRAQGGLVLRAGCERVQVLDNQLCGGAGHGITLGSPPSVSLEPPGDPVPAPSFTVPRGRDARVQGRVLGPDEKPLPGVQITLRRREDGTQRTFTSSSPDGLFQAGLGEGVYEISEGAVDLEIDKVDVQTVQDGNVLLLTMLLKRSVTPPPAELGFLYDIAIERNRISAMGLCGIGVPLTAAAPAAGLRRGTALAAALALLGSPVIGLAIRDNQLLGNLRHPFDAALRAAAQQRGLGGISLGMVDEGAISGNRIEGHGRSGIDPVCGIYVQYGETLDISHNTIVDNGALPTEANAQLQPGRRGGVLLQAVANFGLFALLRQIKLAPAQSGSQRPSASAARLLANHIEQPVGCALVVLALGPLMVNDNVLASERSAGGEQLDALAGTVLLINLAGVQQSGLSVQMQEAQAPAGAQTEADGSHLPAGTLSSPRVGARLQTVQASAHQAQAAALLPGGATQFNCNQVRAGALQQAPLTQLLLSFDDLGFADNQVYTDQSAPVFANTLIWAASLRATGNRLRERAAASNLSLLTISSRMNNTSFNQGDHCIVSQDSDPNPPHTVQSGNQVLFPSAVCARLNMITALLFKPVNPNIQG